MKKIFFFPSRYLFLKMLIIKTLKHVLAEDRAHVLWKFFFKNPFRNAFAFLTAFFSREEKFSKARYFFHNLKGKKTFAKKLQEKNTLTVFGISYCQKPLQCPSLRFSSDCLFDSSQPVCRECLIGIARQSATPQVEVWIITTSFSFIEKILALQKQSSAKELLFLVSACPFAIQLFAPWASFFHLQGLSFPLSGALCSNFAAFKNAEKGEKNGLSLLQAEQKKIFFRFLAMRKRALEKSKSF